MRFEGKMKKLQCLHLILWMHTMYCCARGITCPSLGTQDSAYPNNCSLPCSGLQCSSDRIQGFTKSDLINSSGGLSGCIVDEYYTNTSTNYIVFVKSGTPEKIYLDILQHPSTSLHHVDSGTKRRYQFALFSSNPVTWVISYDKSAANYSFWTSKRSNVQGVHHETRARVISNHVGRDSIPLQLKYFACSSFNVDSRGKCSITAFLQFERLSVLKLTIGKINSSASQSEHRTCELSNEKFTGDKGLLAATSLSLLGPDDSCSLRQLTRRSPRIFIVHLAYNTRNVSVDVELEGSRYLDAGTNIIFVLYSLQPVTWIPFEPVGKTIAGALVFKTSSGSVVNTEKLNVANKKGFIREVFETSNTSKDDVSLLDTVRSMYDEGFIVSYSKFAEEVTYIKVIVEDPPRSISRFLVYDLTKNFYCSSQEASIVVSECTLQKNGFTMADLKIGNCSFPQASANSHVEVKKMLSPCGLIRLSRYIKVQASIRNSSFKLICWNHTAKLKVYNGRNWEKELEFPTDVSRDQFSFFAESKFGNPSMSKFGNRPISRFETDLFLDNCYLFNNDNRHKYPLVKNNCPTNESTSLFVPYPSYLNRNEKIFRFSFKELLAQRLYGSYMLKCVLSQCSINNGFPSPLSKCHPKNGLNCNYERDSPLAELIEVGPFIVKDTAKDSNDKEVNVGVDKHLSICLSFLAFFLGMGLVTLLWYCSKHQKSLAAPQRGRCQRRTVNSSGADDFQREFEIAEGEGHIASRNGNRDCVSSIVVSRPQADDPRPTTPISNREDETSLSLHHMPEDARLLPDETASVGTADSGLVEQGSGSSGSSDDHPSASLVTKVDVQV